MSALSYTFSWSAPSRQLIDICFEITGNQQPELLVRLPFWRPGRYEAGNFARNMLNLKAETGDGGSLSAVKQSKESWLIDAGNSDHIKISYQYYASELNAGSTYLDAEQLYVNPVNCCLFIRERMEEPCEVILTVPENYQIASDLKCGSSPTRLLADNFDRLADAPFIASPHLQHNSFELNAHTFHLWFMGKVNVPMEKVTADFHAFCEVQLDMMGKLPGNEYHFLFQILPVSFYHGVEHTYSTVCALGPGPVVFNTEFYNEFLGVSSHELFHAWNVKKIRPSEMSPYDLTTENFSRLGWVNEGITTYYGDQFLIRSGVFSLDTFLKTFNDKLKKHFVNYGRFNQPVSEASFDTWIDGYVPGIPHRKTSIYTEGSLCAFMLDMLIREHSSEHFSLDDLMRKLYTDAQQGTAYSRERLFALLNGFATYDFEGFYATYIEGTGDYEPLLRSMLDRVGLTLVDSFPYSIPEHAFGFTVSESGGFATVSLVAPGSPAEHAGMMTGDQFIACNGTRIRANLPLLAGSSQTVRLQLFSKEQLKEVVLTATSDRFFAARTVRLNSSPSENQRNAFNYWIGSSS